MARRRPMCLKSKMFRNFTQSRSGMPYLNLALDKLQNQPLFLRRLCNIIPIDVNLIAPAKATSLGAQTASRPSGARAPAALA
jgi:hypothetical protein